MSGVYGLRAKVLIPLGVLVGMLVSSASALAAAPEAPTTISPAKSITGVSAVVEGTLNPKASAKAGWYFAYNQGASCTEGPTTAQEPEVTGKAVHEQAKLEGLEPSRTYTFCLVATNAASEFTLGTPEVSFKTKALPPAVSGEVVPSVTPFEARLEGAVNANNQATTCKFEYGETTAYGSEAPCELGSPEAYGEQGVGASITGLSPATKYHFRIVAENAAKEVTKGPDQPFTTLTLEDAIVSGQSATAITSVGAKLSAVVNPNYQETTYGFEYSTSKAAIEGKTGTKVEGESPLAPEFTEDPISLTVGGLEPRVTYYYRVFATNGTGTAYGTPIEEFITQDTATVSAAEATEVMRSSVLLSGSLNPTGSATTYHFVYIAQAAYESAVAEGAENPFAQGGRTPESSEVGSDHSSHQVGPIEVSELQPGTTYEVELIATNLIGTTMGPVAAFTTASATPPISTTGGSAGVSQLSASIGATVDTRGLPSTALFELGTTTTNATIVPAAVTETNGTVETLVATFSGSLQPGTTYYYRVVASNHDGVSGGAWQSFATPAFPSAFPATTPVPLLTALIPKESAPPAVGVPTRAEKLKKALKACQKKPKSKRASCQRQARKKYGPVKKKK